VGGSYHCGVNAAFEAGSCDLTRASQDETVLPAAARRPGSPATAGVAPAAALLVDDNDSEHATGASWVDAMNPCLALISVGARYGPAQAIADRLAGRAILRADLNGTLTLFTDGE
jgi:hypothetical protein